MSKEKMILIGVAILLIACWWVLYKKPAADEPSEPVLIVPESVKDVDPGYSDRNPENGSELIVISDIQQV